jgi:hypothetical protein
MSAQPELLAGPVQAQVPADLEVLFNTNDYVDLSALDNTATNTPSMTNNSQLPSTGFTPRNNSNPSMGFESFGDISGQYNQNQNQGGGQATMMGDYMGDNSNSMSFDFGQNGAGFGGEMLAGEGMDTVSDGLRGGDQNQGL